MPVKEGEFVLRVEDYGAVGGICEGIVGYVFGRGTGV